MVESICIDIERLPHAPADLPRYHTAGAAGMDLIAAIDEPMTLYSLDRVLVPTGFKLGIPEGYEAQVRARSGLSIKHGIGLVNGIGTIDWDYRDEIKVGLVNLSQETYTVLPGDRIAQLVIAPVTLCQWQEVTEVFLTARTGGFGSTGR